VPLPDPGTAWPPKPLARVYHDLARWGAWWQGDPDELSRVYGGGGGHESGTFRQVGLRGTLQRFWWGQPPKAGEQRTKIHVPIAAEIAQVSADLIFGQPPSILVEDDDVTQARIDELIGDRAGNQLHEAAEACAALGHVFLRVGWDRDVDPDGPLLSVVDADAALPVYAYGKLREVTFVREWNQSGTVLRHLELHQKGVIWHAAYLGGISELGKQVPLTAYPETQDVAEAGMIADPDMNGSGIETGIDMLDVVGVANSRSVNWRHLPAAKDLGAADISGVEQSLDALDDCFSSWMQDIRHGRSRIHVPQHMLDDQGLGKGATFHADREIYSALNSLPGVPLAQQLVATQFKIRYEEHLATATALMGQIVGGCGYSLQTFGLDASTSTQTATEAWARQNRTQSTRNGKLRAWNPAIVDLTKILLAVDVAQFGGHADPDADVCVQFADTVSDSQLTRAQTASLLAAAGAASTETLVELVHNDWDGERQAEEVARIKAEQGLSQAPVQDGLPPQHDQGLPPGGTEPGGSTGIDLSANTE
jgi:hypothetical protein